MSFLIGDYVWYHGPTADDSPAVKAGLPLHPYVKGMLQVVGCPGMVWNLNASDSATLVADYAAKVGGKNSIILLDNESTPGLLPAQITAIRTLNRNVRIGNYDTPGTGFPMADAVDFAAHNLYYQGGDFADWLVNTRIWADAIRPMLLPGQAFFGIMNACNTGASTPVPTYHQLRAAHDHFRDTLKLDGMIMWGDFAHDFPKLTPRSQPWIAMLQDVYGAA